ncbi:MTA/SAH nucleosidase [uncultured Sporomusa sp.]|uniref:adenosylhomocysteine nucleosidase n=1 Tax=uncultured Sporomusa sp. TaxID=307249 RepID=A0A212LXA9_9FIRM|nr:5'-methylthioadenosine/adenosylhomocysteine nucleosidase [uncultured Sporomusa sp.]SCM82126.1 MTA/SAH nucleosidase [uncultured Sporomusa sp.]
MLIGIIGAMEVEIVELTQNMTEVSNTVIGGAAFHRGKLDGYDIVVGKCGVGKVHAAICTQSMIMKYAPDVVINIGIAGSLNPDIKLGDIIIATAVVQHDFDATAFDRPPGMVSGLEMVEFPVDKNMIDRLTQSINDCTYHAGIIATGDCFLNSAAAKERIVNNFRAIACDMESGSIAQVCYINKVPFGIIRSISDNADQVAMADYPLFKLTAAKRAAVSVRKFLQIINKS